MNSFEQMKLVYDYIKFHLGLYLATPPVFVIVAESFDVKTSGLFQLGLVAMITVYLLSGIHAGNFMGRFINTPWTDATLREFEDTAYTTRRRNWHHTLYWAGLAVGVFFLAVAAICRRYPGLWSLG
jgi:hypothetical protein